MEDNRKDIIIIGRPRAGKSTLADKLIDRYGYQIIRLDALRNAFRDIFPELGIAPDKAINNEKWYEFLKKYYEKLRYCSRHQHKFIIEGCEMQIKKCLDLFGNEDNLIYVLGQIDITPKDMADNIVKYDTQDDWTRRYEYKELLAYCEDSINKAKALKKECIQYGLQFFDTAKDREKVLNDIMKDIEKSINKDIL